MADRISELPAASALTGAELLPIVQDGETRRVMVGDSFATLDEGSLIVSLTRARTWAEASVTAGSPGARLSVFDTTRGGEFVWFGNWAAAQGAFRRLSPLSQAQAEAAGLATSASNGLWIRPWYVGPLEARWAGAVGDGASNEAPALNACLDAAITINRMTHRGAIEVLLHGTHRIDSPLLGFYHNGSTFQHVSFSMRGAARGYIGNRRVAVVVNYLDGPGLVIQKARSVTIRGISFAGPNTGHASDYSNLLHDTGTGFANPALPWWNQVGMRDERYSPSCGICIDPFSAGTPVGSRYPALAAYYTDSASGSSNLLIEECEAQRFIVGIAVSLSTATQLGDSIIIRGCNLSVNKVCVAAGQSQNRGVMLTDIHVNGCQVFADTTRYGQGNGPLPVISGGVLTHVKWLIIGNSGWGQGQVTGLYVESLMSLGFWGWNSGGFMLTLNDCHVKFVSLSGMAEPDCQLHAGGPVTFNGGYLGHYSNVYRRISIRNNGLCVFNNVVMDGEPMLSDYSFARFSDCPLRYSNGGTSYGISDRFTTLMATLGGANVNAYAAPYAEVFEGSGNVYAKWVHRGADEALIARTGVVVTVGTDGTATFSDATFAAQLQVGDHLQSLTAWFGEKFEASLPNWSYAWLGIGRVSAISGADVTLNRVPKSFASGTYTLYHRRLPIIRQRTVGTITSGSNSITGVTPTAGWTVGSRIRGTGIPVGAFITAISGSTFTISQNATGSGLVDLFDAQMHLEDAVRAAAPTTGSWFRGDFVRNALPTKDANNMVLVGWRCTVTGSPGTWEPQYVSAVTPAT